MAPRESSTEFEDRPQQFRAPPRRPDVGTMAIHDAVGYAVENGRGSLGVSLFHLRAIPVEHVLEIDEGGFQPSPAVSRRPAMLAQHIEQVPCVEVPRRALARSNRRRTAFVPNQRMINHAEPS